MSKTIMFGDKEYALVPGRLKEMRESNPRASVETEQIFNPDNSITFKATIILDLSDEYSARATGSARYTENELKKPKAFEKLETVSVGRALSNLGWLNDGQIASTEEMLEFEEYKLNKVDEAINSLYAADTIDELKNVFMSLGTLMADPKVVTAKDLKKLELQKVTK